MKKSIVILLMLVICTGMLASGQAPKKKPASRSTATLVKVVGHTYSKRNVKLSDPELAAAYDNGQFKFVLNVSVYFVTEDVAQVNITGNLESDVYSREEMEQARAALGMGSGFNDTEEKEYTIKNGRIYWKGETKSAATINKGGKSITLNFCPFEGNVLQMIE